jgi:sugar phosphate isomerase/epimerase
MTTAAPGIKRCVSLYSFQEEYFLGKLDLEGCLKVLQSMGVSGVEVIGEQMFPGFPHLTDARVAQWRGWMEKYGLAPVCHDMFLDTKRYKHRLLNFEESVEAVVRDIRFAAALGCKTMRMIVITPPEVMQASLRYAERYDIKLLLEVHSPWHFRHEWIERHLEVMHRAGSPYLGLMPDLGIFVRRFPRIIADRFIRDGATPALVAEIIGTYDAKGDLAGLPDRMKQAGGNALDVSLAGMVGHYCDIAPREMLDHMQFIHHVHGKFYEMLENETEYSIPYEEIIAVLKQGAYDGYVSSEYEGNRHIQDVFEVDSIAQVRRHQAMLARLIAEPHSAGREAAHV